MTNQFRSVLAMILVAFILLASNSLANNENKKGNDSVEQPTYSEIQYSALRADDKVDFGLKLTAEDVTATGLTLICEQSGGVFEGELASTSEFSLDMFDGAKWIVCDTVIPEEEIIPEEPVILEEEIIPEEPVIPEEEIVPEEPVILEEAVEEEKPPMPDLSDPNKKMSADEIAALFANLA